MAEEKRKRMKKEKNEIEMQQQKRNRKQTKKINSKNLVNEFQTISKQKRRITEWE